MAPSFTKMEETFHPLYALCFVRACDGWRAWRHTPAVLIHYGIITKGLADWDDLLHPLACCCQTPSFSKDNSVTSTLPPQNKPILMKDCCVSIKKVQIHCYWHQLECCTLLEKHESYSSQHNAKVYIFISFIFKTFFKMMFYNFWACSTYVNQ